MAQYTFKTTVTSGDKAQAQQLATLIQQAVTIIDHADLVTLMAKAVAKPSIVKTALKFI